MPLTEPQRAIFDDPARFRVVSAGRRFGKSFLSIWEMARVARHSGRRVYYVAPSYRMAKQILWNPLKEQLISKRWADKINESDLTITLRNGSEIGLRSADNYDSLRGISLDAVVLDECAFMKEDVWTQVLRPTLSDRKGSALFISTPQGMGNWFYDLYTFAESADNWSAHQYTTIQGGNVTPEEVEAARADLDAKTFEAEYEARFTSTANNIYYAYGAENVKRWTEPVPATLSIGMDFNVSKMTAAVFAHTGDGLHQIDEIVLPNSNTEEMCQEIKNRYPEQSITVMPDPAGSARKTSAIGRTDHVILSEWGFRVKAPRSHPPVKDRINSVNRLLCDAGGNRKYFIDPRCKETMLTLAKHSYKSGSNIQDKDSGLDHMGDSLGYAISFLYPIRKQYDNTERPTRFGAF